MKLKIITCSTGDWEVLYKDGKIFDEGHSIHPDSLIEILKELGAEVENEEISDERMEAGDY